MQKAKVVGNCICCHSCITICPKKAIKIDKKTNKAIIDQVKCIGCGKCEDTCPVSAIKLFKIK